MPLNTTMSDPISRQSLLACALMLGERERGEKETIIKKSEREIARLKCTLAYYAGLLNAAVKCCSVVFILLVLDELYVVMYVSQVFCFIVSI